jgi:hypothetical protein
MKTFGVVREENKISTRKKMPNIWLILSIISHRYFDTNHFITWFVYLMFLSSFSNKLIKSEWNSLQLIIFKVKHTGNNFFEKNAKHMTYFVHNKSPLFWHQPFHNLVRLFPGLFWGQPIDSAGGSAKVGKIFWPLLHRKWKKTRYDYNLTIMKSPKPATDNRSKKKYTNKSFYPHNINTPER